MVILLRLLLVVLLFCSSCTTQQDKDHAVYVAQCKFSCVQQRTVCNKVCTNNCPNCTAHAAQHTENTYKKYMRQEQIQGGIIFRELNSYRDPLQCRKVTCNCSADYNVCIQSCTGIIKKQLRALPYCT